jgi:hypothetical protein
MDCQYSYVGSLKIETTWTIPSFATLPLVVHSSVSILVYTSVLPLGASKSFKCGLGISLCEVALLKIPLCHPHSHFHHRAHSALPSFFETLVHISTGPTPHVIPHIRRQLFQPSCFTLSEVFLQLWTSSSL